MPDRNIQILEFRISFIWTECFLDPLEGDVSITSVPRPHVVDRMAYAEYFDAPGGDLSRPWPQSARQGFWDEYLEHKPLRSMTGQYAYRQLVPLHARNVVKLNPYVMDATVVAEGLLYPWGTALATTVRYSCTLSNLESAVEAVQHIRRDEWFTEGDKASGRRRLTDVAHGALETLRKATFGDLVGQVRSSEPFSIHTVVCAVGPREAFDPSEEAVHRFLHGVTSFSRSWTVDAVPPLKASIVAGRRTQPADHVVYGSRRARAVWAPDHFLRPSGTVRTLGCQHRNLVLASAHLESAAGFTLATARRLRESSVPLQATHRMLAKRATGSLARAYFGSNTYRSGSLRHQIESNDWLSEIDFVRERLEQPPIAAAKSVT